MKKIKLLALFGESSSGKDSIKHWLEYKLDNAHGITMCTTRPKRNYETNGSEYHFISEEEFLTLQKKCEILECTCFNNWFYGTPLYEIQEDKINIGVFNPYSIRFILKDFSDLIDILPVWIKADEKERLLRSLNREKNPNCEEVCRRFLADQEDFSDIDFEYEIFINDKNYGDYSNFLNIPKIEEFIEDKND